MEDYSSDQRFRHDLNYSTASPAQEKGNNELGPPFRTHTDPSGPGQLTRQPSRGAFSGATTRRKETESGFKGQCRRASQLGWTAPKQRPPSRSSPTVRGGTKEVSSAVREGSKHELSRFIPRPLSVGPSARRAETFSSHRVHAYSVNIPEQRRLMRHQQQTMQFKLHGDKDGKVPRRFLNAGNGLPLPDGSVIHSESQLCTASDAPAGPDLPHLQNRRTWMLLQHLVDQLEREGQSDALAQHPELLQKLLHVVMPLVPLNAALGKVAANSKATNTFRLQGPVGTAHHQATRMAQQPFARPASTASLRTMRTNAPPRNAGSRARPLAHYSCSSPTRALSASALREGLQVPRGWSEGNSSASKVSLQYPDGPADVSRNAFNRKDRGMRRALSTRVRGAPRRDIGNPTGSSGVLDSQLHWYDKPRPVRAVSTGNSYTHVASRLPQGAIQHRRPLKTRSHAALVEKNVAGRKPFQPAVVNCATSPRHSSESMSEPVASARSGDSEDTLKSGLTYSPGSVTEGFTETALARHLEEANQGFADWNAHRQHFPVRFTISRDVEALPPSPPAIKSDEEMTPSSRSGGSAGASQQSPVTHEEPQSADRGAALSGLTKTPAGKKRRPVEPKAAAARRHTVATAAAPPQYTAEEDKLVRSVEGSLEGLAAEKRERRLTVAAKFKSTAAAIKGGRLVLAGEQQVDGGAKSQGITRIPLLKDIPKARDARRATVQVTTPRTGSSFSPKLSTGSKGKMSPVSAKKLGKKGSATLQSSFSISPRDLSPPSARGRRMSAPPPRRATQAKIAPALPPRTRNTDDRTSPPRLSPAPVKASARRKTVKLISAKGKCKASHAHKGEESPRPEADSTAPLERDEPEEGSENEEAPATVEPEPEPPYPYLTLKELPPLEQPLRPLSHLCALPLKGGPNTPPPIEDSVTFIHVLERSERLTQEARDEATQRALSHLCNDGPGMMLTVARWLDSAADAVESNSITSSEKFPWRDIIPPFFVGANKHRELLSSKMSRSQFSPKELQEFLEKEGFIETQGQKLQQLLETKGLPTNDSEAADGSPPPKPRTPLDDYLDYLLAVAVYSLRRRQRPVVIAKITQNTFGASDESGSSSSCCTCSSDETLQNCPDEGMCGSPWKTSFWSRPPPADSEKPSPQKRCASCLPMRGSSLAWFGRSSSVGRGFGFPCCPVGDTTGPPELNLFESTARQQVRATACRMPLLPSERYLRYLRLTGRSRELAALAIWLSGRPDVVTSYCERMALKQRYINASVKRNSSNEQKGASHSPTSATNPEREGSGLDSSPDSSRPQRGASAGETAQIPVREAETAREESKSTGGADCRKSRKGVSRSPRSPLTSPVGPSSKSSLRGSKLREKNINEGAGMPATEADGLLRVDGSHINDKSGTSHTESVPTSSRDPPPSPKTRTSLRHRAAEAPSCKSAGSPRPHHTSATPTSATKAKAKKHAAAKTSVPRVALVGQKTAVGSKPLRPLGQIQWQAPSAPGELPSVRDPQKAAKLLAAKQASPPTADAAECEPPESVGTAEDVPFPREEESPALAPCPEDLVKSSSQADAGKAVSAAEVRIGETSPKRPPEHPLKKNATVQSKALASRSSSTKRFNSTKQTARRPGAALQPERTGVVRKAVRKTQSPASRARLTREAMDLLSEPQVLAEMAKLCTRLSGLVCCRPPSPPGDFHSGDEESSVT